MNVVFRVDASTRMGIGHFMRCMTLAEGLRTRGVRVQFVCREHAGNLIALLWEKDLPVTSLENVTIDDHASGENHASWLAVTQEEDAKQTIDAIAGGHPDWLIVDHYALDIEWERRLRPYSRRIMVIDDLANRPHDCDMLLDQNYSEDGGRRYQGLVPTTCKLLIGPHYALLRPEYADYRKMLHPRSGRIEKVFVFLGGSDPQNMTGLALEALSCVELRQLDVDVVIGANNPYRTSIEDQARRRPHTTLHGPLPHLADLMRQADLAIGAGGTTTWERMALGLPSLVITIADNQIPIAASLDTLGYIRLIGNAGNIDAHDIRDALCDEINTRRYEWRAKAGMGLCDGEGVGRVGDEVWNAFNICSGKQAPNEGMQIK